ncbi:MAG: recombination protein RecR [Syntrophaceae bacterium]|nr:recombination protein RecR [Syntrophaceae bacterium]
MNGYAPPIRRLIEELSRFPGVGEKTATRLATFIIRGSSEDAQRLADSIVDVKRKIHLCSICFHLSEGDVCPVCADASRDRSIVCVVEEPDALIAIEESQSYRGTYHVLHGALAPLDGIGPEQLRLQELFNRVVQGGVREVILATNPNVQGESTALLITKLLRQTEVTITRIAQGVPVGGELKYTDRMTLGKALEFRRGM